MSTLKITAPNTIAKENEIIYFLIRSGYNWGRVNENKGRYTITAGTSTPPTRKKFTIAEIIEDDKQKYNLL